MPKVVFAGTSTIAFAVINAVKLLPYWQLGQLNAANLGHAAVLFLPASIAVFAGVRLVRWLPERLFFRLVTWALLLMSAKLLWEGVRVDGSLGLDPFALGRGLRRIGLIALTGGDKAHLAIGRGDGDGPCAGLVAGITPRPRRFAPGPRSGGFRRSVRPDAAPRASRAPHWGAFCGKAGWGASATLARPSDRASRVWFMVIHLYERWMPGRQGCGAGGLRSG